jgi:DNA-binding NarL/FixJ family response regulator
MNPYLVDMLHCLRKLPMIEVPPWIETLLLRESSYLPDESFDDFLSLIFAECLEATAGGTPLQAEDLKRLVWRVRKRLARSLESHVTLPLDEQLVAAPRRDSGYDEMHDVVRSLSVEETSLLMYLLDGASQSQISKEIGLSEATVSRRLKLLRRTLRRKLDST